MSPTFEKSLPSHVTNTFCVVRVCSFSNWEGEHKDKPKVRNKQFSRPNKQTMTADHNYSTQNESGTTIEMIKFFISGFIGTIIFYLLYETFHSYLFVEMENNSTMSWVVSYMLSIWIQYELHSRIVFNSRNEKGNSKPYHVRLLMTYAVYSFSMVLSTIVNYVCNVYLHIDHRIVWLLSVASTGIVNYFAVKSYMK